MRQLKFGSSWIRGVVGGGLTPELVTDLACAFGTWLDGRQVVLARDTRRSSPVFASAVIAGLLSTGKDVLDAGICPGPVAQYLVRRLGAAGAIVVSGGQNDARWNALKLVNGSGALLDPIQGEEIRDVYHLGEFAKADWKGLGRETPVRDFIEPYLNDTAGRLDAAAIRKARFRVAVDLGNGSAGALIREFLAFLECSPILVNEEMTGDFARSPAPTRANMRSLAALLRHVEAHVGFALNTDADHLGIVTEKGEALSEEHTLPLIADHVLAGRAPATVVTNLSTSMMIDRIAAAHNGRLIRTKIGEGNVMFAAVNEDALLAGEGSGGVAFLPLSRAFDGLLAMALVLEAMACSGRTVSELRAKLPAFHIRKGTVSAASERIYLTLEEFRRRYHDDDVDLRDGVRVRWPGCWLHVRASTTEPILRIIAEGEDERRVETLFTDAMRRVHSLVHGKS